AGQEQRSGRPAEGEDAAASRIVRRAVVEPAREGDLVPGEVDTHAWQAGEGVPLVGGHEAAEHEPGAIANLDGADLARIKGVGASVRDGREVLLLEGTVPESQAGCRID